ncbi:MAG: NAD(P)H-binding protein [Nitrospirota bacterium]|nr:NAD(P)H-binding protein [Nitrospirota bacterium]
MSILLVGGTGIIGCAVAHALLGRGIELAALTRSRDNMSGMPFSVSARLGDLSRPDSLNDTLADFESVFLVTPEGPDEAAMGVGLVKAIKQAGCKQVVYLSAPAPAWGNEVPMLAAKRTVEDAVRDSGLRWTILRPNHLFQNDLACRDAIAGRGIYPLPLGDAGISRVDVRDVAEVAAAALTGTGHNGKTYRLDGPDPLTGREVAAAWKRHMGRSVVYAGDDVSAWAAQGAGDLPAEVASAQAEYYRQLQRHGLHADPADLKIMQEIVGRSARSFEGFAAQVSHTWQQVAREVAAGA